MIWWTKWNFLHLFPKSGKDQWDSEIGKLVHCNFVTAINFLISIVVPLMVWCKIFQTLLGYSFQIISLCISVIRRVLYRSTFVKDRAHICFNGTWTSTSMKCIRVPPFMEGFGTMVLWKWQLNMQQNNLWLAHLGPFTFWTDTLLEDATWGLQKV